MRVNKNVFSSAPYALLMAGTIVLSGCADKDVSDLEKEISAIKARPKQQIEPLPEIKVIQPFIFNPEGLRDPFKAVEISDQEIDAATGGVRPDTTRVKEELESYSLDSLRMVGTIDLDNHLWGLIKASDGSIHRVKVGNYMGKSYGKIIHIDKERIELVELVPDKPGTWREQQASIALAE